MATLFFDGYCTLCNNSVDFLMRVDKRQRLSFGSLQSETAQRELPQELRESVDSVILKYNDRVFVKSDAALEVCRILGGGWHFFRIFKILPRSWRDAIYEWVARNRYRWFGKRETCRMPTPEEKARFVD
jgi:predicted DCC family thiol-disulfide oxidoreductase YuxK